MQIDLLTALKLGAALAIGWGIYRDRNAKSLTKAAKGVALEKFKKLSATDGDPRFHFNGATSRILKVEETGAVPNPDNHYYTLAIWAENIFGEVFHIRINADAVLLKHVPENIVRAQFPGRKTLSEA